MFRSVRGLARAATSCSGSTASAGTTVAYRIPLTSYFGGSVVHQAEASAFRPGTRLVGFGGTGGARHMSTGAGKSPPVGWMSLAMVCATGTGLLYYYENEKARRLQSIKAGPSVGKAAIGGPFKLVNAATGKPFTDESLQGEFALLYFGFTMCPDICPDELLKMADAVGHVEKAGKSLQPVFISIDPERDTVARVKEYVAEFHPKLIGLTGSVQACKDAAKQYRVYYHKTSDDPKDYLVDHSIIMYLVDPKGGFVTFYGKNYTAADMGTSIVEHMKRLGH